MSPTHYRLSTRLARHLRSAGCYLPQYTLAEQVLAIQGSWMRDDPLRDGTSSVHLRDDPLRDGASTVHQQDDPHATPWRGVDRPAAVHQQDDPLRDGTRSVHLSNLLRSLLDGRFEQVGAEVGLWEWKYSFPARGEAVVVLDIETTGLSPDHHEIIELALIRLENGHQTRFERLVNPGTPIPPFISRLTGIANQDVRDAADTDTVLSEALPLLEGATLIIQNAGFDLGFLQPRLKRLGYRLDNPVVDTIHWARKALPALSKRGLDALAWAFDLGPITKRHRAMGDVETTLQVAREMYYMLTAGHPTPSSQLAFRAG